MRNPLLVAMLAALSACAARHDPVPAPVPAPALPGIQTGWRAIVTDEDMTRLTRLPDLWADARKAAARFSRQIAREGALLVAGAARNHPAPSPGSYKCRLIKMGTAVRGEAAYRSFPEFFCHIRGEGTDGLYFTKQTGSDLPGGWLHADGDLRFVFTGARQRAGSDTPLVYGSEPDRDVVGVLERVGPFRWRLVLPWRGERSGLDIYELTPVPVEQQAAES